MFIHFCCGKDRKILGRVIVLLHHISPHNASNMDEVSSTYLHGNCFQVLERTWNCNQNDQWDITQNVQTRVIDLVHDQLTHAPIKCIEFHQSIVEQFSN